MATTQVNPELGFEIVKHVTRPLLKLDIGKAVYVTFEGKIYTATETAPTRKRNDASQDGNTQGGGRKMQPPELADVLDLVNGKRPSQIIVNAVLSSELQKKYPEDAYVGKSFRIVKNQIQGKSYATFEIAEVRVKASDNGSDHPKGKK